MQREKAVVYARIHLSNGRQDLLETALCCFPGSVQVNRVTMHNAPCNQNSVTADVIYGPVWGGWQSDISKHAKTAMARAGTSAQLSITNYRRVVVDTR